MLARATTGAKLCSSVSASSQATSQLRGLLLGGRRATSVHFLLHTRDWFLRHTGGGPGLSPASRLPPVYDSSRREAGTSKPLDTGRQSSASRRETAQHTQLLACWILSPTSHSSISQFPEGYSCMHAGFTPAGARLRPGVGGKREATATDSTSASKREIIFHFRLAVFRLLCTRGALRQSGFVPGSLADSSSWITPPPFSAWSRYQNRRHLLVYTCSATPASSKAFSLATVCPAALVHVFRHSFGPRIGFYRLPKPC